MIKKTITYEDYNGLERTEDFYFNLSEAEIIEMELGTSGGFSGMMKSIVAANDTPTIMKVFKDLVLKSYGEKSTDGRRFVKTKELSEAFSQTEAYSKLYMELATDTEQALAFSNGIMPKNLMDKVKKENKSGLHMLNTQGDK